MEKKVGAVAPALPAFGGHVAADKCPSSTIRVEATYMRVLLADHHPKVRWALRTFIGEEPEFTVIGEASDADTLLSKARTLDPDLILLEWELAERPVGEALSALQALHLRAQVVVLSWQPGIEQIALDAGADGFVSKAHGPETLLAALRELMDKKDR